MRPFVSINLVPVREWQRAGRRRMHRRVEAGISAAVALILFGLTWREWNTEFELKSRLESLVAHTHPADDAATHLRHRLYTLQKELAMLESIGGRRAQHALVLRSVTEALPGAVWLTSFSMTRDTVLLEGRAEDHTRIAEFLRELGSGAHLKDNQLTEVIEPREAGRETSTRFLARARIGSVHEATESRRGVLK